MSNGIWQPRGRHFSAGALHKHPFQDAEVFGREGNARFPLGLYGLKSEDLKTFSLLVPRWMFARSAITALV